jgi:hypothetical protein
MIRVENWISHTYSVGSYITSSSLVEILIVEIVSTILSTVSLCYTACIGSSQDSAKMISRFPFLNHFGTDLGNKYWTLLLFRTSNGVNVSESVYSPLVTILLVEIVLETKNHGLALT